MIDTVVFDLGAVLIGWDPRHLYRKLTSDETKIENFLSQVCHGEWNSLQDAGRPFAEGVRELSEKFPEYREWIELYHSRWDEMISGQIEGTVEILNELALENKTENKTESAVEHATEHAAESAVEHAAESAVEHATEHATRFVGSSIRQLKLFALTNWSAETFPYALKTFPFLQKFQGIVVSGDEKLIKPDPAFFQILLDRYSLEAKQCVFIDDVERNVAAAEKLGFHALLFRNPLELRGQLEQLGLLKKR